MRRAPSGGARTVRLEVARGGDVVYGEDYGAAPSAVLGRAEEAFGDGHLVGDLPGVAGYVAWQAGLPGPWVAVVAIAPAALMRSVGSVSSSRSSTAMAQAALGGRLLVAGCSVAATLMCTAFAGSG